VRSLRAALEEANDFLEEEASLRDVDGVLKPVNYRGKHVGTITELFRPLLLLLLKMMRRPEIYSGPPRHTSQAEASSRRR
jgi:hypothetical protein